MKKILLAATITATTLIPATSSSAQTLRAWCGQNAHLLEHAPDIREQFPDAPVMVRVSCCESKGNPSAVSRTGDYGLGQINWRAWSRTLRAEGIADSPRDLLEPDNGIAAMRIVYDQQGLRAWRPSRGCWS